MFEDKQVLVNFTNYFIQCNVFKQYSLIQNSALRYQYSRSQESTVPVKVNACTFRGSNSVIFIVASHINRGHIIKERICCRRGKLILLRVEPILGRLRPPGKQTGGHENCLSLK